ncbi:PTS sugar transporter subunit IIA [Williamsoniiplasma lucivorax]|uniref:PTS fructose transporter subunit IIA n=1 Tax=Williamsoniiplasma lucivorax TaxID=209274 RepID=A0A2S5RCV3_9MOLU|nr:PTS sugar transporter subunit IIA [Williamsoniiplasma lucivorax]PPE05161.1 PTS fructose transporter subunit IIA [Williamsoniiplasma lucivorax]
MFKPKNVFLHQKFNSKEEILQDIALKFKNENVNQFYIDSILTREKLASFAIGNQIAIPHGTYDGMKTLNDSLLLFYHLEKEIKWDGEPVRIIIALAIKPECQLNVLQNIAVNSMNEEFFEDLIKNPTIEKVETLTSSIKED